MYYMQDMGINKRDDQGVMMASDSNIMCKRSTIKFSTIRREATKLHTVCDMFISCCWIIKYLVKF